MKKTIQSIIAAIIFCGIASAQEVDFFSKRAVAENQKAIPVDSKILLEKLAAFEKSEMEAAEKRIAEKRKAVMRSLSDHMEREAKAGHMDEVLALKTLIEGSISYTDSDLEKIVLETKWHWDNTGQSLEVSKVKGEVTFKKDGTLRNHKGAQTSWAIKDGKLTFWDATYTYVNGMWKGQTSSGSVNMLYAYSR